MLLTEDLKKKDLVNKDDASKYVRMARVTKVYDASTFDKNYGKVELTWLDTETPVSGLTYCIEPINSYIHGYGVFSMPSVNDIAVCIPQQDGEPIVIGFINPDKYQAAITNKSNSSTMGYLPKLHSGEIFIKSKAQSSVFMKKDGSISIKTKSPSGSFNVVNEDLRNNYEPIIDKVSNTEDNNTLEIDIGPGRDEDGTNTGCAATNFKVGNYSYVTTIATIETQSGVVSYNLPLPLGGELSEVISATLYDSDGKTALKTVTGAELSYSRSYIYTHSDINNDSLTAQPCTLDQEIEVASVTIPKELVTLIARKNVTHILSVTYTVRVLKGGIRMNTLGDIVLDGRNIILRSSKNKSYLGLFDSGDAVLHGNHTDIGDVLGGNIVLTRGGTLLSSGTSENGQVLTCGTKGNSLDTMYGPDIYFYITGDLPLIRYNIKSNQFSFVTAEEYKLLNIVDKYRITSRTLDSSGLNIKGAFTPEILADLLLKAKQSFISYDDLRKL